MNNPGSKVLAVIPARGGSKGIANKNIRPLAGLPLIAHTILFSRLLPEVTRCIVSTDSETIANVAREYGADVPFLRPAELAQDSTPMWPVLRHALSTIEASSGETFDYLLLIDPTTPGRLPEDIAGALKKLRENPSADGIVGVSQPEFNPLWNCWVEKDGWMQPVFEGSDKYAYRQEVPKVYRINASLYVWTAPFVRKQEKTWRGGKMLSYEIPDYRAIHIDDIHEFNRADILVKSGYIKFPWLDPAVSQ